MKEYEVRDLGASMTSNIIDMAGIAYLLPWRIYEAIHCDG